jgi:protein NRD1
MGTNIITELDSQLASLNQLKPPGASKGKITSITQLCVSNIQVSITFETPPLPRDL